MIRLEDLGFAHRVDSPILAGLSAIFDDGSLTAVVGKSGAGKSTLLYLIGLMLAPRSGRVEIDATVVSALPDWRRAQFRAQRMGFVFQDALLDPARTIVDNVVEGALYSNAALRDARGEALRLLTAHGVMVDPDRKPGQISGGQAQRVALCRAFIGNPAIILADEPTGNLDDETANLVWSALAARAANGATVIVATHDRHRARTCDQVIEIGRDSVA